MSIPESRSEVPFPEDKNNLRSLTDADQKILNSFDVMEQIKLIYYRQKVQTGELTEFPERLMLSGFTLREKNRLKEIRQTYEQGKLTGFPTDSESK